jgi:DNA mismatch repair ATPase MutS
MSVTLDRIDSAPIASSNFDHQFLQWIWVLVDSLNENIVAIEQAFNLLEASNFTQTQITDMQTAGQLTDGILIYDTTNNEYVGRQVGTLVKFTTTSYP